MNAKAHFNRWIVIRGSDGTTSSVCLSPPSDGDWPAAVARFAQRRGWDAADIEISDTPPALEPEREIAEKTAEADQERDEEIVASIEFEGHAFQADRRSREAINRAANLAVDAAQAGQDFSVDWITVDNQTVTLDGESIRRLRWQLESRAMDATLTARARKDEMTGKLRSTS